MTSADTIVAMATPSGRGAVGIVRLSGAEVPRIAREILGMQPPPRRARLANFLDARGDSIDQGLALYFPSPQSFTGEHVLELQGHGGPLVMDLLLKRALELGCRMARPGEFSERAFLSGKIDIAQAEAVADLIGASTAAAAKAAVRSMRGEFSARIQELQMQLTELRAYVEAAIDFPDEEIDFLSAPAISSRMAHIFGAFDSIAAAARQGALLREGLTVVIAGKPNAGKSSLLNRLVGDEVAIVTPAPGTTRDVLRQQLHLDGLPLNLVDTAGLRAAADAAEEEGIRRAGNEMRRADHILYVLDASVTGDQPAAQRAALEELPADVKVTFVVNKIDLTGAPAHLAEAGAAAAQITLSARTGAGIELLREHLKASAGYLVSTEGAFASRRRHLDALARARGLIESAAGQLRATRAFELFAEDLRLAQQALGEITGEFGSEELLSAIFGSFCIGK
jgi:tRNA modification GTPase